jgi:Tubulin-tyrosine ligase family
MLIGKLILTGADFLIGFDLEPILLEVNANPDLSNTTKTTKTICPQVMEDVIKGMSNFIIDFVF